MFFFFSSRRRHTRSYGDWSSDVCSSDLLEALRQGMVGGGPRAGWRETIGARVAEVEAGRVVIELEAHAGHRHAGGVVQGGSITQIADAAMGMSLMTRQEGGESNTTIDLK